ncbi:MAG: tetratricopeptide repeat protein [Phycisphaerales bacterium]|nr:tetratricopeptide repeat protein [Phycisphaerales bacterium]
MTVAPGILEEFDRLINAGKLGQARQLAERQVAVWPNEVAAVDMMRTALVVSKRPRKALEFAKRAVELAPGEASMWDNLAVVLTILGEREEAAKAGRKAVELNPEYASGWVHLASILMQQNKLVETEELCIEALKRFPGNRELVLSRAAALLEQGRADESEAVLAEALFSDPADVMLAGFLCSIANYRSPVDRAKFIAQHRNYARLLSLADLQKPMVHAKPRVENGRVLGRGKDGRVRLAFMSSDLRTHSVAYFLEPILRHLDRSKFDVLCYSLHTHVDNTTRRLRALVSSDGVNEVESGAGGAVGGEEEEGRLVRNWREVAGDSAAEICKRIGEDRVDVLFDLNGLTLGARSDVMRLKPAPVMVNYLGYPATAGMATVDYRLVDWVTDPAGCEDAAVEKLERMEGCFLCYQPPRGEMAAEPGEIDEPGEKGVVFGSFNNLMKFNDDAARVWARVLKEVAGSRLVMKAASLRDEGVRARTMARFVRHGVDAGRVELLGTVNGVREHLEMYRRVHVGLDIFPYAGTTTTCEAMYMGVPVVTLAPASPGAMHAHRVGASLLTAVGVTELIATSEDEYVRTAAGLARDVSRLKAYRATLRSRVLASSLCDQKGFAARFAAAVERMWRGKAQGT